MGLRGIRVQTLNEAAAIAALSLIGALALADRASAQIGVEAQLVNDYRIRGYSLSGREPAASLALSYDDISGAFAELRGIVMHERDDGLAVMGGFATLGYAKRLSGDWTADVGLLRAQYTPDAGLGRSTGYTELFAGATGRHIGLRVALSPDYLWDRTTTVYASGQIFRRLNDNLRVTGHVGLLTYLRGGPPVSISRTQYDWSLQLQRQLGRADLRLGISAGGPDRDYFGGSSHSKSALTAGLSWTF